MHARCAAEHATTLVLIIPLPVHLQTGLIAAAGQQAHISCISVLLHNMCLRKHTYGCLASSASGPCWLCSSFVCTRLLWMAGAGAQIALTTNLSRWMLVPSSMVDLDGSSCNMVGTGYTAFANQAVCHSPLLFTVIRLAYTCKVKLPFKQYVTGCRRNSPLNLRCSHACFVNGAFG